MSVGLWEIGVLKMSNEEKAISMCRHAIGMSNRKPYKRHGKLFFKSYRNHYDAGIKDIPIWEQLVEMGYAYKNRLYHLTDDGVEWLSKEIGIIIKMED